MVPYVDLNAVKQFLVSLARRPFCLLKKPYAHLSGFQQVCKPVRVATTTLRKWPPRLLGEATGGRPRRREECPLASK